VRKTYIEGKKIKVDRKAYRVNLVGDVGLHPKDVPEKQEKNISLPWGLLLGSRFNDRKKPNQLRKSGVHLVFKEQ